MKSWKKRLKEELDAQTPPLDDGVRLAPIPTSGDEVMGGNVLVRRKGIVWAIACFVAVLLVVFSVLGGLGILTPHSPIERFVFSLEINPAVSFVTDEEGTVESVSALNEDADVVLSFDDTLIKLKGANISDAAVIYTDCAAKLGYLDVAAQGGAVRLSCGDEASKELLSATSGQLSGYFKDRGIFAIVVEEVLPLIEFANRIGVESVDSLNALADKVQSYSEAYGERYVEQASIELLQARYDEYVLQAQLFDLIKSDLLDYSTAIVENLHALTQIRLCAYQIMMHPQNPTYPIPTDFWSLKQYIHAEYQGEFANLMEEMQMLLDEYEEKYGVRLDSLEAFSSTADVYASLLDLNLSELFESLSKEQFSSSAVTFIGMLKNVGCDVSKFETLVSVPQTTDEYLEKIHSAVKSVGEERAERYIEEYEREREQISSADYEQFCNDILENYGSFDNFWKEKIN